MRSPHLPLVLLILMIVLIVPAACKPLHQDTAALDDIRAGESTSAGDSLMNDPAIKKKKIVLIYYANDTYAPTSDDPAFENFQHILKAFKHGSERTDISAGQRAVFQKRLQRYEGDWNNFRKIVDMDARFLTEELCNNNPRFDIGLVVFRNSGGSTAASTYTHEIEFTFCVPGAGPRVGTMEIPNFQGQFPYQSQPLSHPTVFNNAIEEVMKRFPMGAFRYVLITKSHGSRDVAISPFVGRDVRSISIEELAQATLQTMTGNHTLGDQKESTPILDDQKESTPILDDQKESTPILGDSKEDTPILGDSKEDLPILDSPSESVNPHVGVSKATYLDTIKKYRGDDVKFGAYFSLVFMEACKSDMNLANGGSIADRLQASKGSYTGLGVDNIGLLYTTDVKGLPYWALDFRTLFGPKYGKFIDFDDAFRTYLDRLAKK